ncbi:flagellar hook-basal body complex protein FliE [Paenibacillus provencensis]|uniref:Flagellar hook-basal body complex protein FliE n=1 Tax=Paenibacillus provencensis TaxID=441151 RepID=A0ABW3PSM1_9BACL|nr:flagellar hook-basal body complex protein FliE [Paenibacillus sp. MER 78]
MGGKIVIENTMFKASAIQTPNVNMTQGSSTPTETIKQFSSYLEDAITQVADQEKHASEMSTEFVLGNVNVDQVMVASQQALLSLQLTTQVRNKVIEAYQEIMRIQM